MNSVAFDISPLSSGHKFRGVGFYTKKLYEYFNKYKKEINKKGFRIIFFEKGKIPKEVNLVHYPYFDPFFLTLPLFKRKKTIVTVHDLIPLIFPDKYPRGIRGELKWQIQKLSLKNTTAIITDSNNSKNDIKRIIGYPQDKIFPIYLAPDEKFKKLKPGSWVIEIKEKYNLSDQFILYVGDVNYNKNVKGLIKAFANVKSKSKILNLKLVLVGGAFLNKNLSEIKEINNLIRNLGLGEDIIMTGQVTDEDLVKIYNLASLYIQPSFYEGFGLPVLEAMACGCPVVSSNKSSLPEVGGEAVYYINPKNEEEIAKGMVKVINDNSLRKKLIEKGFNQVKKFNWQKTLNETISVYKKFLS